MILELYRARLCVALEMVGERDVSPADVDGLKLAISDMEEGLSAEQAKALVEQYRANVAEARNESDSATERGLWWAIRAMEQICKA